MSFDGGTTAMLTYQDARSSEQAAVLSSSVQLPLSPPCVMSQGRALATRYALERHSWRVPDRQETLTE